MRAFVSGTFHPFSILAQTAESRCHSVEDRAKCPQHPWQGTPRRGSQEEPSNRWPVQEVDGGHTWPTCRPLCLGSWDSGITCPVLFDRQPPRAPGQWLLTPAPGSPPRRLPAAAAPRQGWVTAHQGRGVPAGNPCDCRGRLAFHWTSALGRLPECGMHLAGSCPVFGTSREASSRLTGWQNVHRPLRRVPWRLGTQEE